jgi:hypothetical protein
MKHVSYWESDVEDGKPEALMISSEIQILLLKVFENHVAAQN